uniref:C3H1-type domain-containing protein n=1 Tax=Lates calcarifer TaxID=8187 RepID=A0A4W6DB49_LATCA
MAFANLFTGLSAVDEDVQSPGQPTFNRNENDNGKRGNARKRKTQAEQTGPDKKKQRYQAQTHWTYNAKSFEDDDSEATHCRMLKTDSDHAGVGFTKEGIRNCSGKPDHKNWYQQGQNYKAKSNGNMKRQTQQKNQHQQRDRGRHASKAGYHQTRPTLRKGGGDGRRKDGKQDVQVKPTRFMTQEFKDQNALLVDGQLLCRHFLWGRCIKEDNCQLKHIQGYNDLIKEVCKFYVQGHCTKGESCPYMHKSFPCKFFHKKGRCSQGADCRFSHEPLNELTKRLLDEALKRENDLYELAKKAEQESSGQPANTDESEITEANGTPDIPIQPLRPNFYNSGETNTEQEALLCRTEEPPDIMETAVPPQASDSAQPHSPQSTNPRHEEPVCYSVEAVLGRQLFKPFPNFFTTPGSQESVPLSVPQTSSDCTSGSADQSKVPYFVDTVDAVGSCKSVGDSPFGHIPTPPTAQTVSYTPESDREALTGPLLSSETEKVLYSLNTRNEVNKFQESVRVHADLISKTCPDLTLASGDHRKQDGEMPASLKPVQRALHEVKLELLHSHATVAPKSLSSQRKGDLKGSTHLPVDITCSVNCKSESAQSLTFTPKHPTQLKKSGSVSHHFAAKQPTEIHQHSKTTQSGLKLGTQQHYCAETKAECSSKMAHSGDFSVECNKTQKIQFPKLFTSPIIDSLKPTPDFETTPACPQSFIQPSCPTLQSAHCIGKDTKIKTVTEPDKTSARTFLSLFAAPPKCIQSLPDYSKTTSCFQESNQSADNTSHLLDSKQRALNLETLQVKTGVKQTSHRPVSPKFPSSCEPINQAKKLQMNPISSLVSDSLSEMFSSPTPCGDNADPSITQAQQQLASISSPKGSAVAATTNSVLKTLFLCLSPYQNDGEQMDSIQISLPSENEKKNKTSTGCVFVKQQRKSKRKRRQKEKLKSTDKAV